MFNIDAIAEETPPAKFKTNGDPQFRIADALDEIVRQLMIANKLRRMRTQGK
jgi:hypothetical protein